MTTPRRIMGAIVASTFIALVGAPLAQAACPATNPASNFAGEQNLWPASGGGWRRIVEHHRVGYVTDDGTRRKPPNPIHLRRVDTYDGVGEVEYELDHAGVIAGKGFVAGAMEAGHCYVAPAPGQDEDHPLTSK